MDIITANTIGSIALLGFFALALWLITRPERRPKTNPRLAAELLNALAAVDQARTEIRALRSEVAALRADIAETRGTLAGSKGDQP